MAAEDARLRTVIDEFVDLHSHSHYLVDICDQLGEPLGAGYSIDVPSVGDMTVTSSGATGASAQSIAPDILRVIADKDPAIFIKLSKRDEVQLLKGTQYGQKLSRQAFVQFKNYLDQQLVLHLLGVTAYSDAAAYHHNVAGADLTDGMILNARGKLLQNKGTLMENIALMVNPMMESAIMAIPGFATITDRTFELGAIGVKSVGSVAGIPVFSSNSIYSEREVAVTASEISSNVLTCTVASGHGLTAGVKIKTDGLDADQTTSTAITSVTATEVVLPLTASDDATNGAGNIIVQATENLLVDLSHVHVAQQMMPELEIVPYAESTNKALQISNIWGYNARVGRARVIYGPLTVSES